jgi:anti-sigma regulatory factor (Ser/Thr protein kinase)
MELVLTLPADLQAARVVRGTLDALRPLLPAGSAQDVRLLTSELVTNAVKHSGLVPGDHLEVRATASSDRVRVEVVGGERPFAAEPQPPPHTDPGGWGLLLVSGISDLWGTRRTAKGTAVWFEVGGQRSTATGLRPIEGGSGSGWTAMRGRQRRSKRGSEGLG